MLFFLLHSFECSLSISPGIRTGLEGSIFKNLNDNLNFLFLFFRKIFTYGFETSTMVDQRFKSLLKVFGKKLRIYRYETKSLRILKRVLIVIN